MEVIWEGRGEESGELNRGDAEDAEGDTAGVEEFSTQRRRGAEGEEFLPPRLGGTKGEISGIPPEGGTPNAEIVPFECDVAGDGGGAGAETGGPSKEEELLEEPPEGVTTNWGEELLEIPPEGGTPNAEIMPFEGGVAGDGGGAGAETGGPSKEEELLEEPPEGVITNWGEELLKIPLKAG